MLLNEAFVALGCCGTEQTAQSMWCAAALQSHFCAMISPELGAVRSQKSHPQERRRISKFGFILNYKLK